MGVLLEAADVVIGNYNHLFDPKSRPLVESVLDERTFLIVDEAHRLEERVRDLLSRRVGRDTLVRARNDCATLLTRARESREDKRQVRDRLRSYDVPLAAVERVREFSDDAVAWLDDRVGSFLDAEFGRGWRAGPDGLDALPEEPLEIPLRDPETAERDEFTAWAERAGYAGDLWRNLTTVGAAVEGVFDELDQSRTPVCAAVGATMKRWWERDHATCFREVELDHSPAPGGATANRWEQVYTAGLLLYDCMPAEQLRRTLDELGGGVLMSATLEPLDVFTRVSGLDSLAAGTDGRENGSKSGEDGSNSESGNSRGGDRGGSDDGRPVVERTYDLPFPEANRASWIVDAEPFTARNRGEPVADNDNDTREQYRHVLRSVARSPGNVMVAMPSYREAAWAGDYLDGAVEKPVLVDASTANEETERLKRDFFAGEGKVLVTSTRGTLTEGVDYDGEKLHTCAVVGIPLVNVGSPRVRAVRHAYGDAFGEDNAFEYALTVPAVRRARQAIGRVIRGSDEVGVRILVDERYTPEARYGGVYEYLPPGEREEFVRMTPEFLKPQVERFWRGREP
jgi:DNA excision repair protein ERCC-2